MSKNINNKNLNKITDANCKDIFDDSGEMSSVIIDMDGVAVVKNKELKKVVCYEVERYGQTYILNVIATRKEDKIECKVIVTKENETRACTWNKTSLSANPYRYSNYNVENCAYSTVDEFVHDIIDHFEQETVCLYSSDRVKRNMRGWAEKCEKEGFKKMYNSYKSNKTLISNPKEQYEIHMFVENLKVKGLNNPIEFCEKYIVEMEREEL